MSEDEIKALVGQREAARQAKDFATADALRDQLRKNGVEIYDKDKYWKANTGVRGTIGMPRPGRLPKFRESN